MRRRYVHGSPLPGALTCVGKYKDGQRMFLPVKDDIENMKDVNIKSSNKNSLRSFFNTIIKKTVYIFSKTEFKENLKERYKPLNPWQADAICKGYMDEVNKQLEPFKFTPKPKYT